MTPNLIHYEETERFGITLQLFIFEEDGVEIQIARRDKHVEAMVQGEVYTLHPEMAKVMEEKFLQPVMENHVPLLHGVM